jgi:hypothetical protein
MNDLSINKWETVLDDATCKIEKKYTENNTNPILRTTAVIDGYPAKDIFELITVLSVRKEWDKNFSELYSVEQNMNEGYEVLYMIIKVSIIY